MIRRVPLLNLLWTAGLLISCAGAVLAVLTTGVSKGGFGEPSIDFPLWVALLLVLTGFLMNRLASARKEGYDADW